MQKMLRLLPLVGLLFCGLVQAEAVNDLNVASVQVANASPAERERVLPSALGQVLVKISGNPSVMTLPVIQNSSSNINGLIQSYSYSTRSDANGHAQLMMQVTFDKNGLITMLQKAGQAIWSSDRPMTLVWLNIQNGADTNVLSNTDDTPLLRALQKDAEMRGVPILLPAMDLQDQSFINTNKAESFDIPKLQQATQRYAAKSILAGNISGTADDRWHGQWLLLVNGVPYRWENTAPDLNNAIAGAVTDMANLMANQLAVVNDKDLRSDVTMEVKDVSDLGDYAKVLNTLRHLSPVAQVTVKDMTGSELLLQIKTLGGEQALTRALSSKRLFAALPMSSDQGDNTADLYYRWLGDRPPSGPITQATDTQSSDSLTDNTSAPNTMPNDDTVNADTQNDSRDVVGDNNDEVHSSTST